VCSYPYEVIEDYYFNETTRLRTLHKPIGLGKQFITIKSIGMLERDEFEYEIKPTKSPKPLLIKERYFVPYKEHTFEVNSYGCYFKMPNEDMKNPLRLIEVELQDKDEQLELPVWVGKEVTDNPYFYNYNLFKFLKESVCI
jgi:CYTH domain-containing protein